MFTVGGSGTTFPMFSFLIVHSTPSLDFEAMVGSAGYGQGSASPWDANSFTLSHLVFPVCLENKTSVPMINDSPRKNRRGFELILAQLPQEE